MIIGDQIRDEKLQYDINREAVKISALSPKKFSKYEYLTGEEILPSNQKQMIEQAKFTYSALGKGFEKQIVTIEDRGEKQVKAWEDLKLKEQTKPREQTKAIEDKHDYNLLMQGKTFNRLLDERMDKIREINRKIKYKNLTYYYITPDIKPTNFIEFRGPLHIFKEIKNGDKTIQAAEKEQIKLKSKLAKITSRNLRHKLESQKDTIKMFKIFMIQDKKLSIYLMIIQELDLTLYMKQNMVKQIKKSAE